jgi:hypothetical protein
MQHNTHRSIRYLEAECHSDTSFTRLSRCRFKYSATPIARCASPVSKSYMCAGTGAWPGWCLAQFIEHRYRMAAPCAASRIVAFRIIRRRSFNAICRSQRQHVVKRNGLLRNVSNPFRALGSGERRSRIEHNHISRQITLRGVLPWK